MAIRSVNNILIQGKGTVGSGARGGEAFGGFITSFNLDVSKTDTPSSLSITIDSESGKYQSGIFDLPSYLTPYRITIRGLSSMLMYLTGVSEDQSATNGRLTLDFVDGSHCLDRIYIGLLGTHDYSDDSRQETVLTAEIPVACEGCTQDNFDTTSIIDVKPSIDVFGNPINVGDPIADNFGNLVVRGFFLKDQKIYKSKNKVLTNGNLVSDGGVIILGDEDYGDSDCSLKNVTYSFNQLKDAIEKNSGIKINIKTLASDRANLEKYRKDYQGTLREVLNSWCSDFGVSFSYDIFQSTPTISEIDLNNPKSPKEIRDIKSLAQSMRSTDPNQPIVEAIQHSKDNSSTEKTFFVSRVKKDFEFKDLESEIFYETFSNNININDIFGLARTNTLTDLALSSPKMNGRTVAQFLISCSLAKYNKDLWTIYNMTIGNYSTIGMNISYMIDRSSSLREQLLSSFGSELYLSVANTFDSSGANNFLMAVGLHSEEVEAKNYEWEKSIAETFIGKYFANNIGVDDPDPICPDIDFPFKLEVSRQLSPDTSTVMFSPIGTAQQQFAGANGGSSEGVFKFPFNDILRYPIPLNKFYFNPNGSPYVNILERSDSKYMLQYGGIPVDEEYFNLGFEKIDPTTGRSTGESLLDPFLPKKIRIDQTAAGFTLKSRFANTPDTIKTVIEQNEEFKLIPYLILAPDERSISKNLRISGLVNSQNFADEGTRLQNQVQNQSSYSPPCDTSSFLCSKQQSLAEFVCKDRCIEETANSRPSNSTAFYKIFRASQEAFPEGTFSLPSAVAGVTNAFERLSLGFQIFFQPINDTFRTLGVTLPLGVHPLNCSYAGNYIERISRTELKPKVVDIINDFKNNTVGNFSKVNVVDVDSTDMTNYLRRDSSAPQGILNLWIPGDGNFQTHEEYYNFIKKLNVSKQNLPQETLDLTIAGIYYGALDTYIFNRPDILSKFNISVGEDGLTTSVSFESRPAELPSPDLFSKHVGPRLSRK